MRARRVSGRVPPAAGGRPMESRDRTALQGRGRHSLDPRAIARPGAAATTGISRADPIEMLLAVRRRGAGRRALRGLAVRADRRRQLARDRTLIPHALTVVRAPTAPRDPTGARVPVGLPVAKVRHVPVGRRAPTATGEQTGARVPVGLRAPKERRVLVGRRALMVTRVLAGLHVLTVPLPRRATVPRAPAQQGVTSSAAAALHPLAGAAGTTIARASVGTVLDGLTGMATVIEAVNVAKDAVARTGTAPARTALGGIVTGSARVFLRYRPASLLISWTRLRERS